MTSRFSLLLLWTLLGTGCVARRVSIAVPASPSVPIAADIYKIAGYQPNVTAYNAAVSEILEAGTPEASARAKYYRDTISHDFMGDVDYAYGVYVSSLFSQKGAYAIAGDVVAAGLTTGSAISLVMRTKTILSAIATGMAGVSLSVDKNLFAQQTFAALTIAMQARRDQARATIDSNLALDVLDYPLAAVRRDLIAYFYSGSLPGALQEIQEEAAQASASVVPASPGAAKKLLHHLH
jgi:hypothetical protein